MVGGTFPCGNPRRAADHATATSATGKDAGDGTDGQRRSPDFNNALSPTLGRADLLLEAPQLLDAREELLDSLKPIRTSALDAANVIRRLRGFSRGGQAEEAVEDINVNEVIESSINLTQPHWRVPAQAEGRAIDVDTVLEDVPTISMNESELREVQTNLIMNAADAMPQGGTINFHTKADGEMVAIEVSDTGLV